MDNLIELKTNGDFMNSLDIAEVTGKRHADVMRDVRNEINELGSEIGERIFALTSYKDRSNRDSPCYSFGKEGAMQLALKYDALTRYKVIQYIEKLESASNDPITIALQAALDTRKRVDVIETDVQQLKETTRIDTFQEKELSDIVKRKVLHAVGGKNSNAYSIAPRVFPDAWRVLKNHFGISSYKSLPRLKYDEAVELLDLWQPSASLQLEINSLNKQMDFGDDLK